MNRGKTNMPADPTDESLLLNYLLGSLSEEEQVLVEDRAFSDAEYLGALETAEADLIDSYVRGELSTGDRRRFEGRFFTSPDRRRKVEFAKTLRQVGDEWNSGRPLISERQSAWQTFRQLLRGFHPAVQLAAGMAALIVVAGAVWLAEQNSAMRLHLAALEAQRTELEIRERTLRQQLNAEQARIPETPAPSPPREHSPLLASLVFLPGLSRAEGQVQQLMLSPGTQLAHIEIQLEPRDNFPRFRAELRKRSGEEVLVRSGLSGRRGNNGYSVSFDVATSTMSTGEYELALRGQAGNQTTDIGYYYFRVQKQ